MDQIGDWLPQPGLRAEVKHGESLIEVLPTDLLEFIVVVHLPAQLRPLLAMVCGRLRRICARQRRVRSNDFMTHVIRENQLWLVRWAYERGASVNGVLGNVYRKAAQLEQREYLEFVVMALIQRNIAPAVVEPAARSAGKQKIPKQAFELAIRSRRNDVLSFLSTNASNAKGALAKIEYLLALRKRDLPRIAYLAECNQKPCATFSKEAARLDLPEFLEPLVESNLQTHKFFNIATCRIAAKSNSMKYIKWAYAYMDISTDDLLAACTREEGLLATDWILAQMTAYDKENFISTQVEDALDDASGHTPRSTKVLDVMFRHNCVTPDYVVAMAVNAAPEQEEALLAWGFQMGVFREQTWSHIVLVKLQQAVAPGNKVDALRRVVWAVEVRRRLGPTAA
jgi:hypothetical protein